MWGQSLKTYDVESGQIVLKKSTKEYIWQHQQRGNIIILVCAIMFVFYLLWCVNTRVTKISRISSSSSGSIANIPNLTAVLPSHLSLPLKDSDLRHLNGALSLLPVSSVLLWVSQVFPNHIAQVTSFGVSGIVLLHHLEQLNLLPSIPVISIDTLHMFPESYLLIARIREQFASSLKSFHILTPSGYSERSNFDESYGSDLWQTDPSQYGYLTKVEPLTKALANMNVTLWMTGRRRSQGGERANLDVLEKDLSDPERKRLKLNPLAFWTKDQVWEYIHAHSLPYNALHDKGYASIGDVMNTRPIKEGEDEREGRFVGQNHTECGMHTHLAAVEKLKAEAKENDEEFQMPHLPCEDCIEVTKANFDSVVLEGQSERPLLVEFYSPMCSFCQTFAPKYSLAATRLKSIASAARMDITMNKIPPSGEAAGFAMTGFPTIYLVRFPSKNTPVLLKYDGATETDTLVAWVQGVLSR